MVARSNGKRFALGPYVVDYQRRKIFRGAADVDVHWRGFEALRELINSGGDVVDKNRLFELLWPGVTVEESNLHKQISQLRKALNSHDPDQDYIETIPRVGYRLLVPVRELPVEPEDPLPERPANAIVPTSRNFRWIGGALIIAVLLGALAWWRFEDYNRQNQADRTHRIAVGLVRTRELASMKIAADQFRHLVEAYPRHAPGWAGLAEASALIHPEDASASLDLAQRSVQIDSACGECHAILGFILFTRFWKWDEANEHIRRAVALSPDDPQIRYWMAQQEAAAGRPDKALQSIEEALKRLPHGMNLLVMRAGCLYFTKAYDAAVQASDQALALNLTAAWYWRAGALFQTGHYAEALRSVAFDLGTASSRSLEATTHRATLLASRYHEVGLSGALEDLLTETSGAEIAPIQSHNRATWFMLLGRHDSAIRELEIAVESRPRPFNLIYLGVDPLFDPIRNDSRFRRLWNRLGIGTSFSHKNK